VNEKSLLDRLKAYALRAEWSAGNDHCPQCGKQSTHSVGCELGGLCDDIRLVQRARELEPA
jgi:hypothetical protein